MKENNPVNQNEDYIYVKEKTDIPVLLPENLSRENIAKLVDGKKQKTPKKTVIRRWVALGLAACLAVCSFVIYDWAVYNPSVYTGTANTEKTGAQGDTATASGEPLTYAQSYTQLGSMLNDYRKSEKFTNGVELYSYALKSKDVAAESAMDTVNAATAADTAGGSSAGNTYSDTNVRTQGVLEADVIKTDGEYLYILDTDSVFHIVTAQSTPQSVSETDVETWIVPEGEENASGYAGDFYLKDNMVILVTYSWRYIEETDSYENDTVYLFADISDPAAPGLLHKISYEGSSVATRIVGDKLVSVTVYNMEFNTFDKDDPTTFVPAYSVNEEEKVYAPADSIAIVNADTPDAFITVSEISLTDFSRAPQNLTLLGDGWDVYCTASSLYVYYETWQEKNDGSYTYTAETHILAFDIAGETPVFVAKTCFEGNLLNTWSLDEYNGNLRLAVTDTNEDVNYVYVLNGALEFIGKTEAFAPGESLYAVRFSGDTAYAVTFYQTDPLFVVDLSEPTNPVIAGELKLPGFSNYLHPVGDNLMLGVGVGGDDNGTDGSAKLSLFDVSDPNNPVECDSLVIDNAWFNTEYKAFVTMGEDGYLLPLTEYTTASGDENGDYAYTYSETDSILYITVENGKIIEKHRFTVSRDDDTYCGTTLRAAFVNNTVFAVDVLYGVSVTAFDRDSGEITGQYQKDTDETHPMFVD